MSMLGCEKMKYDDVTCPNCGSSDWENEGEVIWEDEEHVTFITCHCNDCGALFMIHCHVEVDKVELDTSDVWEVKENEQD